MRRRFLLPLAVASMWSSSALAAECESAYTIDMLLGDLVAVEGFVRGGDTAAAASAGAKMEAGLACLDEVIPKMISGRALRAVASAYAASGNTEQGVRWYRTAAEVEQSFDYGVDDLPEDSSIRDVFNQAKSSSSGAPIPVEGVEFGADQVWIDGRKLDTPEATADRPHLVQTNTGSVQGWLIDGNAFPESLLSQAVAEAPPGKEKKAKKTKPPKEAKAPKEGKEPKEPKQAKAPKEKKPKSKVDSNGVIQRQRPWEKTPLMLGGGLVMLGGGGLYYLALNKRGEFNEVNDVARVEELRPQINQLVILSAAVGAVGAGTLTWGVILDGGTPMPAFQFQF